MARLATLSLLAVLLLFGNALHFPSGAYAITSHATGTGGLRRLLQTSACECMKKQLAGNCDAVCKCLEEAKVGIPPGGCLPVCKPCDDELAAAGCPDDGNMPVACLQPASYSAEVQKCSAVADRQC